MDRPDDKNRENPAILGDERLPATANAPEDIAVAESPRVSDRTNVHDAGSDANDTADGLTESEEAVRQSAEDIPTGLDPTEVKDSIPVFERGGLPPRA